MWTEQEAEAKLSELLQRALAGEAQIIGGQEPCVVLSKAEYDWLSAQDEEPHLGRWLIENTPRIGDLELPPRERDRPVPFADWDDEEDQ